jgi:DNA-binding winged helix-turn-helix (wHTH) protein/Tol biopolymer transport system component
VEGPAQRAQRYSFGNYEFDASTGELKSEHGQRVLQQQPAEILVALLERPGELVTRMDLVRRLWPNGTYVDFDRSLNKGVTKLREALEDSAEDPKFIKTLPRRGYRFIAPVNANEPIARLGRNSLDPVRPIPAAAEMLSVSQTTSSVSPAQEPAWRKGWNLFGVLLVAGVSILAVLPAWHRLEHYLQVKNADAPQLVKLTDNRGTERVAISPEGRYIAYTRRESGGLGLWVRQTAMRGSEVRILAPEVVDYAGLSFSPDENNIYFVRDSPNSSGVHSLYMMPVLGGPAKLMFSHVNSPVSFSPDGRRFVFTRYGMKEDSVDVCIAAADGSEQRLLATLSNTAPYHQSGAAWSPDGRTIALSVMLLGKEVRWTLKTISVRDGSIRELYSHPYKIGRPLWLEGGHSLLVALDDQNNNGQLYILPFPHGQTRRVTHDLSDYEDDRIDLTRDGKIAAIVAWNQSGDLWQAPAADLTKGELLASSGVALMNIAVRPDGEIMAAGLDNRLWQVNADGSKRTLFGEFEPAGSPFFCGPYVLFLRQTIQGDANGIMRADADGTNIMQLVDAHVSSAACAPDEHSIFFDRADPPQRIESVSLQGGVATRIADVPPSQVEEQIAISPNGQYLAYLYLETNPANVVGQKITVMPLKGGPPVKVVNLPRKIRTFRWSPDSKGLQYLNRIFAGNSSNLWQQALRGGEPTQLTRFTSGRIFDFQWSRDGKKLLFIRGDLNGDVVLIKNPG